MCATPVSFYLVHMSAPLEAVKDSLGRELLVEWPMFGLLTEK